MTFQSRDAAVDVLRFEVRFAKSSCFAEWLRHDWPTALIGENRRRKERKHAAGAVIRFSEPPFGRDTLQRPHKATTRTPRNSASSLSPRFSLSDHRIHPSTSFSLCLSRPAPIRTSSNTAARYMSFSRHPKYPDEHFTSKSTSSVTLQPYTPLEQQDISSTKQLRPRPLSEHASAAYAKRNTPQRCCNLRQRIKSPCSLWVCVTLRINPGYPPKGLGARYTCCRAQRRREE